MRSDRGCKVGRNYYYREMSRVPFLFSWPGRVHNSCKRLSSARAARSPAFHAGVTCKSLHRNWGTCRHGRQRGTRNRVDGEKGPDLDRGKTATLAPERDGTLSRVSTDLVRSISPTSSFFAYVSPFSFTSAGSESNSPRLYMTTLIHIHTCKIKFESFITRYKSKKLQYIIHYDRYQNDS